jgi:ABC-type uncharacterized transport system permease subunit
LPFSKLKKIMIHALAALMIGEKFIVPTSLKSQLGATIVGALIYAQIQSIALTLGLAPYDLKFLTGLILILILLTNRKKKNLSSLSPRAFNLLFKPSHFPLSLSF